MSNVTAPKGQVWICTACGKRAHDRYGFDPINRGYDESCMLHAILCYEDKLVLGDNDRVKEVLEGGVIEPQPE